MADEVCLTTAQAVELATWGITGEQDLSANEWQYLARTILAWAQIVAAAEWIPVAIECDDRGSLMRDCDVEEGTKIAARLRAAAGPTP